MPSRPAQPQLGPRGLRVVVCVLAFGSGATDAFAFLSLGGVFVANMTGNLVLVGLVSRPHHVRTLLFAAAALLAFAAALVVTFRRGAAGGEGAGGLRSSTTALAVAAVLQLAVLVGWESSVPHPAPGVRLALVAASAAAMGVQTVVARRLDAASCISTTFMTGTIVNLAQDLAEGRRQHLRLRVIAVAALVAGGLTGGVLAEVARRAVPAPAAGAVVLATALLGVVVRGRAVAAQTEPRATVAP